MVNNIKNNDYNYSIYNNIITPKEIKKIFFLPEILKKQIYNFRKTIINIIQKTDKRKIIICGPCSVHDKSSIFDYATLLSEFFKEIKEEIFLVLRVYLEKPRSSIGWKGFINDPYLDNTCNIEEGLKQSRQLLIKLAELGIPLATEILDLNIPNYLGDLFSWYAIGARNSESQLHRELISSLNVPVGFKNSTDGSFISAINSIISSSQSHTFLGLNSLGKISIFKSKGNNANHIILRGGKSGPNYFYSNVTDILQYMQNMHFETTCLIDCSHDNANKYFKQQENVFNEVMNYINNNFIIGLMLESHIYEGNQLFSTINKYEYGVSITDSCISWDTTEKLILKLLKCIKNQK